MPPPTATEDALRAATLASDVARVVAILTHQGPTDERAAAAGCRALATIAMHSPAACASALHHGAAEAVTAALAAHPTTPAVAKRACSAVAALAGLSPLAGLGPARRLLSTATAVGRVIEAHASTHPAAALQGMRALRSLCVFRSQRLAAHDTTGCPTVYAALLRAAAATGSTRSTAVAHAGVQLLHDAVEEFYHVIPEEEEADEFATATVAAMGSLGCYHPPLAKQACDTLSVLMENSYLGVHTAPTLVHAVTAGLQGCCTPGAPPYVRTAVAEAMMRTFTAVVGFDTQSKLLLRRGGRPLLQALRALAPHDAGVAMEGSCALAALVSFVVLAVPKEQFRDAVVNLARDAPGVVSAMLAAHAHTQHSADIAGKALEALELLHVGSPYDDVLEGVPAPAYVTQDAAARAALVQAAPAILGALQEHSGTDARVAATACSLLGAAIKEGAAEVARADGMRVLVAVLDGARTPHVAAAAARCLSGMPSPHTAREVRTLAATVVAALKRWGVPAAADPSCAAANLTAVALSLMGELCSDAEGARAVVAAGAVPAAVQVAHAHLSAAPPGESTISEPLELVSSLLFRLAKRAETAPAVASTAGVARLCVELLRRHGQTFAAAASLPATVLGVLGDPPLCAGDAGVAQLRSAAIARAAPAALLGALRAHPEDTVVASSAWHALHAVLAANCNLMQGQADDRPSAAPPAGPAETAAITAGAPAELTAAFRRCAASSARREVASDDYLVAAVASLAAGCLARCCVGAQAMHDAGVLRAAAAALSAPLAEVAGFCSMVTTLLGWGCAPTQVARAVMTGGGAAGGARAALLAATLRAAGPHIRRDPALAGECCHMVELAAYHSAAGARLALNAGAAQAVVAALDAFGARDPALAAAACDAMFSLARRGDGAHRLGRAVEAPLADRIVLAGGFRAGAAALRTWTGVDGGVVQSAMAALDALSSGGGAIADDAARKENYAALLVGVVMRPCDVTVGARRSAT